MSTVISMCRVCGMLFPGETQYDYCDQTHCNWHNFRSDPEPYREQADRFNTQPRGVMIDELIEAIPDKLDELQFLVGEGNLCDLDVLRDVRRIVEEQINRVEFIQKAMEASNAAVNQ